MRFQEIRGFRCARRHLGRGPHGSLTALLGPSGSGKSTLLRAIPGSEKQDSGEIFVFEEENTQVPPQKRGVGFVFQHYAAFKPMPLFENVAFGLKIRKRKKAEIRKRVHELLELVQLEAFADRYPAQLSGGQRQQMALALWPSSPRSCSSTSLSAPWMPGCARNPGPG